MARPTTEIRAFDAVFAESDAELQDGGHDLAALRQLRQQQVEHPPRFSNAQHLPHDLSQWNCQSTSV